MERKNLSQIEKELNTNFKSGLTKEAAEELLIKNGKNVLRAEHNINPWLIFARQFKDFLIYVLFAAVVMTLIIGEIVEAIAIIVAIFLNTVIGFFQELNAENELKALKSLTEQNVIVIRDDEKIKIPATDLVVGDIVVLETGGIISADLRLVESYNLKINESTLTGESIPVEKDASFISDEKSEFLGDKKNMTFSSTFVTNGRGLGVVVGTGRNTEISRIADLVLNESEETTPLEKRINKLGKGIGIASLLISALLFLIGFIYKIPVAELFLIAVTFAVKLIPESLSIIITIVLAFGVKRMARRNAIIRKLSAVETLGSVNIVCTDKTGTLTLNKMTAVEVFFSGMDKEIRIKKNDEKEALGEGTDLDETSNEEVLNKDVSSESFKENSDTISDDEGSSFKTSTENNNKNSVDTSADTSVNTSIDTSADSLDAIKRKILFEGFTLCEDATISDDGKGVGDPTEIALVEVGLKFGIVKEELEAKFKRIDEIQFDSTRKMMTTIHSFEGREISFTKGAIDEVLEKCDTFIDFTDEKNMDISILKNVDFSKNTSKLTDKIRNKIKDRASNMSNRALRVISLAVKVKGDLKKEEELIFLGFIGMIDPPREEAKKAVRDFRRAGIKTIMITGDHKLTAFAIAKEIEIATCESEVIDGKELDKLTDEELTRKLATLRVFARVSPEHKYRIIKLIKNSGNICSMTGDGVNDAPSLKAADIGVSMGITGTDVAEEASDMVLVDDNFFTIRNAIEEGRKIFINIKKTITFILASIFADSALMLSVFLVGFPVPLNALQILWTNMVADILPYLSLGIDHVDADVMKEKPRSSRVSFFSNGAYRLPLFYGMLMFLLSLIVYLYIPLSAVYRGEIDFSISSFIDYYNATNAEGILNHTKAQTLVFVFICLVHSITVFAFKDSNISIFKMKHSKNKLMFVSVFMAIVLQFLVCNIPLLQDIFKTTVLSLAELSVLFLVSLIPIVFHEIIVLVKFLMAKLGSAKNKE